MSAPEPVVQAVMDDGCDPFAAIDGLRCARHRFARVQDRGCPIAVGAADAAFAASLEWAARQFDDAPLAYSVRGDLAPRILRRWARGDR